MKKVIVVYWSGTGNTEAMAEAVVEGIKNENVEVNLVDVLSASVEDLMDSDGIALGCPAMGTEVLEESEMEPFVESLSDKIQNKSIILFGSYGWGSGEWMVNWEARMSGYGANLVAEGLIINETPDDLGLSQCRKLGNTLLEAIL